MPSAIPQPVLAVGLVYNMHYYSGTVYQVAASIRRKNRTTLEVLAAGGRYDDLVSICLKIITFVICLTYQTVENLFKTLNMCKTFDSISISNLEGRITPIMLGVPC